MAGGAVLMTDLAIAVRFPTHLLSALLIIADTVRQ
jgi:hypothetical protein